jgi:hypothetical protein
MDYETNDKKLSKHNLRLLALVGFQMKHSSTKQEQELANVHVAGIYDQAGKHHSQDLRIRVLRRSMETKKLGRCGVVDMNQKEAGRQAVRQGVRLSAVICCEIRREKA